jgi:hypothetical protein
MFEIKEIRDVIAERRLYLEGQPNKPIRVVLGRPQKAPGASEGDLVLCPYQIIGIGDEKVRSAAAIDAVEALQFAMGMIGSELYFKLNRQHGGKLRWEAGKDGDLGFPVPPGLEQEK